MLEVKIENILPITEVRDNLNKIVDTVTDSDDLFVVAKNGKPVAVVVGVHHLEKLTGLSHSELMPDEEDEPLAPTASTIDSRSLRDQVLRQASELPPEDEELANTEEARNALSQIDSFSTDIADQYEKTAGPGQNQAPDSSVSPNPQFTYSPSADLPGASAFATQGQAQAADDTTAQAALPQTSSSTDDTSDLADDELTMNVEPENPALPPKSDDFQMPPAPMPNMQEVPVQEQQISDPSVSPFATPSSDLSNLTPTPMGQEEDTADQALATPNPAPNPAPAAPSTANQATQNNAPNNGPIIYQ